MTILGYKLVPETIAIYIDVSAIMGFYCMMTKSSPLQGINVLSHENDYVFTIEVNSLQNEEKKKLYL